MATLRLVPATGAPHEVTGDFALVGREAGCDIVVSDGSVSRKHARLERRPEGWTVIDQGSANGTFIDSQRVAEAQVRAGQEVRFGAVSFRVELEDDDIAATVVAVPSPDATVAAPHLMATPPLGIPTTRPGAPPGGTGPAASSVTPGAGSAGTGPLPKAGPPPVARPPAPPTVAPPVRPPPAAPPLPGPSRAGAPPPPPAPSAAAARDRFGGRAASASAGSAAPVGQMPAPPTSARKGKSPLFWILTGCCGCLLLGLVVIGGIGGAALFATRAPAQAVQEQLGELRRGDLEAAYGRLSSDLQARLSRDEFEALVKDHVALRDNKDATFFSRSVDNDRARLSGIIVSNAGEVEQASFELRKEGGAWKITALHIGGGDPD